MTTHASVLPTRSSGASWRTRRLAALAVIVAGSIAACDKGGGASAAPTPIIAGVSMLLPSASGELKDIPVAGKITVVDVFAPTCEPCRKKLPALRARQAELERLGAVVIYVAVLADGEGADDARAALSSWGAGDTPFLIDSGGRLRGELGLLDLPEVYVLDASGDLRWSGGPTGTADQVLSVVKSLR